MARAAKGTSTTANPVVKEVTERFNTSWDYQVANHHTRWSRNYKLYNNKRAMVSYEGITNTFVPMTFSTVEVLTAALGAGRPSIDFVPQDMYKYIQAYANSGKKPDLKALNAQFDYYWDCDNWDLKSIKTIRTAFIYGTSCEWVYWDNDKPRIINMNPRDAIIDPTLIDPMQLISNPNDYYTGRRYLTSLDALKAEKIVDPDSGKLVSRFKNLSAVKPGSTGDANMDKQLKETMFLGTTGESKDAIEVLEIWDGERIRCTANRTVEIEDRPNKLGMHCLVVHRFLADESIVYGKAIIDPIAAPQELLNDVTNQSVDAVTDVLLPERELDPQYSDYLPMVESGAPGTVYPFAPGSLRVIDKGIVSPQSFNERANMKNEIRETTGADQLIKGAQPDGGKSTATEINAQLNQAGQRFELYVRMLEKEAFYQRAKIVFKMMRVYVNDKQLVPTTSVDGPKFHAYDPAQYSDDYEPKVQLEASVKSAKAKDQQSATQAYTEIIADPTNDLWEAKRILYPKMFDLSQDELDKIIGAQKPRPVAPGLPPGADPSLAGAGPDALAPPPGPPPVDMGVPA